MRSLRLVAVFRMEALVIERLLFGLVGLMAAAAMLPVILPVLITAAVVGTACFVAIKLVNYFTRDY